MYAVVLNPSDSGTRGNRDSRGYQARLDDPKTLNHKKKPSTEYGDQARSFQLVVRGHHIEIGAIRN